MTIAECKSQFSPQISKSFIQKQLITKLVSYKKFTKKFLFCFFSQKYKIVIEEISKYQVFVVKEQGISGAIVKLNSGKKCSGFLQGGFVGTTENIRIKN